ncbi:hypothetical protein ACFPOI_55105 [Nonomuraea angiospora]|uniref:FtsH-binding integral membrane protein n=1 Tax=Nonomuraea angiospora TaxID=46172 RepID=A0ABR9M812_9ACTN|nr:hypothetical protein [Nonomuraea angiospora]MBE1588745.1 FtsH-binding integral membrane protein [Nonomuraea angiospora]MDX3105493.1 hypothetical protein [Nonomuraea angiospora]
MTAQQTLAVRPATWPMWALKVVAPLHAVALLFQAVAAGLLLSTPGGRALHMATAVALLVIGIVHVVAAILVRWPGGGKAKFILPAVILLVATVVQAILGVAGLKVLHVPLGVLMFHGGVEQLNRVMARQ